MLIVNDNFLIQTICWHFYGENYNNNLSVLKLEICWNKLQFTGIEFVSNAIIIFLNLIAITAKLEFTYEHIRRISEKYRVGSIVFIC